MPDLSYTPVDPPLVQPPRVSLLSSAEEVVDGTRWTAGLTFEPYGCGYNGGNTVLCADASTDPENVSKAFDSEHRVIEVEPFVAFYGDSCSSATFRSRDFVDRATRVFLAAESALIARELWAGEIAAAEGYPNPYFGDGNADVIGNLWPTSPGLHQLQRELADRIPTRGMIHATRDVVTSWYEAGAIRREGAILLDAYDNIVVADAGYPGTGPNGEARTDTTAWAFATDLVQVRRDGQVRVLPDPGDYAAAMDRDVNLIEWRAERIVAAYWSVCAHVAIEIDLCAVECPLGS
jgi:hypothetical protein